METGNILRAIEQGEVVSTCPVGQAITICTVGVIAPVSMLVVEIASIEAGMREYWKNGYLQPCWRGFVNVDNFVAINIHT